MIAEIGLFALILALPVAALQAVVPLIGAAGGETSWMRLASWAAGALFALVAVAFGALIVLYVTSDFSVLAVVLGSHTDKPLLYRIAGVWANHEGSMLLWLFLLALYGLLLAVFGRVLPPALKARVLSVQGMIAVGFVAFVVFTANPFARVAMPPVNGLGLNPLLQDIGLALHPPLLYLGYAGFSIVFSFAVAALIDGKLDAAWARLVRPWTLAAWCMLTAGIGLGAWWSYYTLGWGGWWAWDPVENASLMPWLAGTALLHATIVVEKRDTLKGWTVFLAILTFSLSLTGTFLVRSGVLTSVHAFASDPARGRFILALIAIVAGGSLALFAARAPRLKPGGLFAPVSRESGLVINNLFLACAAGTVLIGTLAPLFADVFHLPKLSVGAPWFDFMVPLLLAPMLLLLPVGVMLAWKRADLRDALRRLRFAAVAAAVTVLAALILDRTTLLPALGLGLAAWILAGTLGAWVRRLPRAAHGMTLAHIGVAILIAGITGSSAWQSENLLVMHPGETAAIAGYTLRLAEVKDNLRGPNYTATEARFEVERNGRVIAVMRPQRRLYDNPPQPKTEVAIRTDLVSDLYVVLGEADVTGGHVVHLFHNPLLPWIFIGALMMMGGGLVALFDRRRRIAAPQPAAVEPAPVVRMRFAVPVFLFLGLTGVLFWRLHQADDGDTPDRVPSMLIGKPAPAFDLQPLEPGAPGFKTADLKGQVTLVNFFASWCAPCRAEHAVLTAAAKRGLVIVGIAYKDKPDAALRFLAERGSPYARTASDPDGRTAIDFGITGVPESYLIDKNGVVRFKWTGPLTADLLTGEVLPRAEALK